VRRLSQVFRGQDFYGEVKLQKIYRSRIAALAQEM
jgi:predicted ribonuclease YlaK